MSSPVNPIVSGILHGYSIANAMTQQRLQQEALARQTRLDDENRQINDITMQQKLTNAGRPVDEAGLVSETGNTGQIAGQAGAGARGAMPTGEGLSYQFQRKADKARTATYKTADGRTLSAELYTPEEQGKRALASHIASTTAAADVETQAIAARNKQKMDTFGVPVSDEAAKKLGLAPGAKLMQGAGFGTGVSALMRATAPPKVTPPKVQSYTNKQGDVTPTAVSMENGIPKLVSGEPARGIASKPDKAAPTLTPYQQKQIDRQKNADARRAELDRVAAQNGAQKQVDALNKQEQLLHAENRDIGARLLAGSKGSATDRKGKSIKVTAEDAVALKARLADNQTKVKALQDRQHGIIMKFAGDGANPNDPAGILGAQ